MKKILILCTGNSCRSQIAHGYLNHLTNKFCIFINSAQILNFLYKLVLLSKNSVTFGEFKLINFANFT